MKSFNKVLDKYVSISQKLDGSLLITAVRRGLAGMIPLLLVGSFALILLSLPIRGYQDFMASLFGPGWSTFLQALRNGTFNILSIFMVLFISYAYHTEYQARRHVSDLSPMIGASVALCSFVMVSSVSKDGFSILNFGTTNVFVAIIVAISSSALFRRLCNVRALRLKSFSDGADTVFSQAVVSMIPAALTVIAFAGVNQILISVLHVSDLRELLSSVFVGISGKIGSPFLSALLFVFLVHILWFFGIHGNNVMEPVAQTIFVGAMVVNTKMAEAGFPPTEIFTKTFIDTFVFMGGCGTTLAIVAAILIAGRHRNHKRLVKLSAVPVLFNISETMIFGLPIVLNPVFLIPFTLVPLLLTSVSYLATSLGLVPLTAHTVEWTTPIFWSGFASTGSISGSLLQLFNLSLATVCYIPFVKLSEKITSMQMKSNLKKLCQMVNDYEYVTKTTCFLTRQDGIGSLARFIANDLELDFKKNKLQLFYQPQVDARGKVVGAEALLRWKHDIFGYVYPPLAIAIAEESSIIQRIGDWLFEQACRDLKTLQENGYPDIVVSVNLSAIQLENPNFIKTLGDTLQRTGVNPANLKIEITEQLALTGSKMNVEQIQGIKQLGLQLAMDDFGMGHSSLIYLKEYQFDTVKLDGSLVREVLSNVNCADIISSIVYLGESLHFSVIAEYVETEEQRQALYELGCSQYQGYLYSPAVPFCDFLKYVQNKKTNRMTKFYGRAKKLQATAHP